MNFRILFLSLVGLMALRCGDNPTWSNDLGIKVEETVIVDLEDLDPVLARNFEACDVTLSKQGRSLAEEEKFRIVVEFFKDDTSVGVDSHEFGGLPGNGARTTTRFFLGTSLESDRCEVTSIM